MNIRYLAYLFLLLLPLIPACLLTNPVVFYKKKKESKIPIDTNNLYSHVDFLSTISPARSSENLESLDRVAKYIKNQFNGYGLSSEYQQYDNDKFKNIIASYNTKAEKRIVIGAHYDVCDNKPGADDNASGIAGLLELARLIAAEKPALDYRIDFVAYSTEEPPYFRTDLMGSAIHAASMKTENINIELMICLEMIGYFSDEKDSQEYPVGVLKWFYPSEGDFILIAGKLFDQRIVSKVKKKMKQVANIDVRSINAPPELASLDLSDHRNYWKHGYNAVMITNTAFFRNKNYHTDDDTIEKLDFERMSEVVKGVYNVVVTY